MNKRDKAETGPPQNPQAAQILVVDDETSIFDVFAMMFPTPRNALAVASNGNQAVQLASAQPFDVAFVDCFLGSENGIEVAQNLRKVQPDLNVVLMSGYLRGENSAATEEAGARAFLTKPFSFETAQALVRRLLGGKPRRTQDTPASEAS
ncbi:MAG: response regulator [Verrucomicrobia bacterium]|nr:response regulator [Verrucomicrobiota bacterium]